MKLTEKDSAFLKCLLLGMAANIRWSVPAWILLAGHFVFGWPLKWFRTALGLWILFIMISIDVVGWLTGLVKKEQPKENKNPYSGGYHDGSKKSSGGKDGLSDM